MRPAKLRPVATLSAHLTLHLVCDIVAGRTKPGSPLPSEPELAAQFEVSKPVVRQSIQALASLGIVRVQQGKRTVVQDETEWNVLAPVVLQAFHQEGRADELTAHLYDVRLALETNAAAWTAQRGSREELDRLASLAERMRAIAAGPRDLPRFLDVDLEFHNVVGAAARNLVLRGVMRALHAFLSAYWQDSRIVGDQLETLAAQHAAIAAAIGRRDPDRARRAMEAHLVWARQIDLGSKTAAAARRPRRGPGRGRAS
jgi:DNA-binding FadR family transcriptional regulator